MDRRPHVSRHESDDANDPGVGDGVFETAPHAVPNLGDWRPPRRGDVEPVRTYVTEPAGVLATAGVVLALTQGEPLVAIGVAAGLAVLATAGELVRARVTPRGYDRPEAL